MEQKYSLNHLAKGFLGVSDGKDLPAVQETRSDPWAGRSPGEGNAHPVHSSCLGNSMDRGAQWVRRVRYDSAINTDTI